jgi:hypothetical protein
MMTNIGIMTAIGNTADYRRYFKEVCKSHPDANIRRVFSSMYSELISGQYFRVYNTAPVRIAQHNFETACKYVKVSGEYINTIFDVDSDTIDAKEYEERAIDARKAYDRIEHQFYKIRELDVKPEEIRVDQGDIDTVVRYLDALESIRMHNRRNIIRLAKLSRQQLLE